MGTQTPNGVDVRSSLATNVVGYWIEETWVAERAEEEPITLAVSLNIINHELLRRITPEDVLKDGYQFDGYEHIPCPATPRIAHYSRRDSDYSYRTGASVYRFTQPETGTTMEVLVVATHFTNENNIFCLAAVPRAFLPIWESFGHVLWRIQQSLRPKARVLIIGGQTNSFEPTISWEDIILPDELKQNIITDVNAFFTRGVNVYKRLNLKPFRKLLLAGVPGTGKTLVCTALAKWALEQNYYVIYISSSDQGGPTFGKIQHALNMAADSPYPTLIILEELDAYLHAIEKAVVLNVLDGSEAALNEHGTLLVATTNYPQAIDERVLKRPGRLDRIFIIPEMKRPEDVERMLKLYLRELWQDDHAAMVGQLVGYTGAFIREVAIYALTQVAYTDGDELPLSVLEASFHALQQQIEARDELIVRNTQNGHNAAANI